jgi:16S rRNA G1207 methylase RsmC
MFKPLALLERVASRIQDPALVILGSPAVAADLAARLGPDTVCYQMDLYQAERLRMELAESGLEARVETSADLWDLPPTFRTAVFPVASHGERELKLDMLEQAYHVLAPRGLMLSLSEYQRDQVLPRWHKKVFGKCSELPSSREGSVYWSYREGEQPRRRHELTFHARIGEGPSHTFVSRPGAFSYGRLDDGARALLEVADIRPGQSILDLGCGVGASSILACDRAGLDAPVTFVDSNTRAVALAEQNARQNGLTNYRCIASARLEGLEPASFDLILANPPYYALSSVTRVFIEEAKPLLRPAGRFYLVTKQVVDVAPVVVEVFGDVEAVENRGYTVLRGSV